MSARLRGACARPDVARRWCSSPLQTLTCAPVLHQCRRQALSPALMAPPAVTAEKLLLTAAKSGDVAAVRAALDAGANIEYTSVEVRGCQDVCRRSTPARARTAASFCADTRHVWMPRGVYLLRVAARASDSLQCEIRKIRITCQHRHAVLHAPETIPLPASLHLVQQGLTSLHIAAFRGHLELVRLLLERGADIEAKSHVRHMPQLNAAPRGDNFRVSCAPAKLSHCRT